MAVTIKDVAQKAGVSISTVSLVLNNKGYVAPQTREKILRAIEELGYRPVHSARKLATGSTGNLGYIVWDVHFSEVEMFYSQIFLGMEYAARKSDYYILLTTVEDNFNPHEDLPRFLRYRDVDGVALAGRVPHSLIDYLDHHQVPFVLIDFQVPGRNYDAVIIDNYNGATLAVEHLIETGKRRVGFVGGSFIHPSIQERYRGYVDTLKRHGLWEAVGKNYSYVKEEETSRKIGEDGARALIRKTPPADAIFACNDTTALGVIGALQSEGVQIPDETAVVGFDNIPSSTYNSPTLTTVDVPKVHLGKEAYHLLLNRIRNPLDPPQTRIISVSLIPRGTTLSRK